MHHAYRTSFALLFSMSVGCASLCDSSLDCEYHAFGGMRDRRDRVNGRVGSLFDPTASRAADVTVLEPLPLVDESQTDAQSDSSGTNADPDTGEVEDSGLTEELLDELRQMRELPNVPSPNGTSATDDSPSSDEI